MGTGGDRERMSGERGIEGADVGRGERERADVGREGEAGSGCGEKWGDRERMWGERGRQGADVGRGGRRSGCGKREGVGEWERVGERGVMGGGERARGGGGSEWGERAGRREIDGERERVGNTGGGGVREAGYQMRSINRNHIPFQVTFRWKFFEEQVKVNEAGLISP